MPSPSERTIPDPDSQLTLEVPAPRPALVLERPPAGQELVPLLRRRLIVVASLAACTAIFFASYRAILPNQWQYFRNTPSGTSLRVFEAAFGLCSLSMAMLMWKRHDWTLRRLRMLELVLVALFAVYIAWAQLLAWSGSRFAPFPGASLDPFIVRQAVDSMAGRWFALIVGVSTVVPETWRRTAAIAVALAASAVGVTAFMGATDPAYRPHLGAMLSLIAFWMVVATTIAVFGSYKLAELRQQVAEARRLGQYRLVRHIGSGGMGEVHLAEHLMLKQPCAIKVIRPELARDPLAMQRFEREVRAMSRLKHWNTVQIYDYGYADDGTFYYVMEYLHGVTLQELVSKHGPLPPGRVIHFLRQICAALREVHGHGLVHRDIKPSNVIACERGGVFDVAKLLDFGVVRRAGLDAGADPLTRDNLLVGTPHYMSPEQVGGVGEVEAGSDIYSVGALAYFLATGQPPFVRGSAMKVLMAHLHDQPQPPSSLNPLIPSDLERVLLKCLAKDSQTRYRDAQELDSDLARCGSAGTWSDANAERWWKTHIPQDGEEEGGRRKEEGGRRR
jgi:serine/threonine-protein kinase